MLEAPASVLRSYRKTVDSGRVFVNQVTRKLLLVNQRVNWARVFFCYSTTKLILSLNDWSLHIGCPAASELGFTSEASLLCNSLTYVFYLAPSVAGVTLGILVNFRWWRESLAILYLMPLFNFLLAAACLQIGVWALTLLIVVQQLCETDPNQADGVVDDAVPGFSSNCGVTSDSITVAFYNAMFNMFVQLFFLFVAGLRLFQHLRKQHRISRLAVGKSEPLHHPHLQRYPSTLLPVSSLQSDPQEFI